MRQMAAKHLTENHPGQHDVVGKSGLPGALGPRVNLAKRLADNAMRFSVLV
jgi:hypothetical protein